ncbi:MAG: hypothetical protein Q4D89_03515 [Arachnia propionica]|uniref:hypothetical protein n=1 Tax=Arachnia propionica TaxID=1750 RepID=UPI00270FB411|nr:hypothetical protein [Arachnia propionica]
MTTWALACCIGMLVGSGLFLTGLGLMRRPVSLASALSHLTQWPETSGEPSTTPQGLETVGSWFHRTLRMPVTPTQERLLARSGRSVADFFTEKLVWATTGLLLPLVWAATSAAMGSPPPVMPMLLGPFLAVAGYFIADWRLARGERDANRATAESLYTFFDLVVLERLANASASQAATSAAGLSSAPLFRRIGTGLEKARLEQSSPWRELERIAVEWELPELRDFADVMRLEEQGAALAETLLARVAELREGHNARLLMRAQQEAEGLTIWMTIPALALGLSFIIPPLLALIGP